MIRLYKRINLDGESYSDWELLTDHDSEKDDDEEYLQRADGVVKKLSPLTARAR